MISVALRHVVDSGKILPTSDSGSTGGCIRPARFYYPLAFAYVMHPENGGDEVNINCTFPGKYERLSLNPVWTGHRFLGWFTEANVPSTAPSTAGVNKNSSSEIEWGLIELYANWQLPSNVVFDATTEGGQMPSDWNPPEYYQGMPFGTLPVPVKEDSVFTGWFDGSGNRVTETTDVTASNLNLTAHYMAVSFATSYEVNCTGTSHLKTGIYSATRISSSEPVVVDWGDGTIDIVDGDISQLVHTYETTGVRTVRISDNISSLALSINNSTWYNTTTSNRYNVRRILSVSTKITSIPAYGFINLQYLNSVEFGGNGESMTLGNYAFSNCMTYSLGTIDLSGRTITSLPSYLFRYCYYLKTFVWPQGVTTINSYAFQRCHYYQVAAADIVIPDTVTSIGASAFRECVYLTSITIPAGVATLGAYMFYTDSSLAQIRMKRATAPTVATTTFGTSSSNYTGHNTASAGTNRLYVPAGATGYDASYWSSTLLNSAKCGFTLVEDNA